MGRRYNACRMSEPITPTSAGDDDRLQPFRLRIDEIDQQLVNLLNERAKIVVEVGKAKRDGAGPVYAPERERRVLEQIRRWNAGPLPNETLDAIWRELMSGSFALERPLRIGYLGPAGSFSHMAARKKFGASVDYDPLDDINAVFEEIGRGHIDHGLVPIENSVIGGIGETLDGFLETNVRVCNEVLINIRHNLLSNCAPHDVKVIYSKPEVFRQCRKWLSVQLRDADRMPVASSSKAADMASKEEHAAAIGSELAAETYHLKVQFAHIEDNPNNMTRFFVIGTHECKPTDDDKTAIMFTTEHRSGALSDVLDVFRKHGLNMTHIDKRPSRRENWEYYFFVDLLGHIDHENVRHAVEDARKHCLQLRVLGSFPRAQEVL